METKYRSSYQIELHNTLVNRVLIAIKVIKKRNCVDQSMDNIIDAAYSYSEEIGRAIEQKISNVEKPVYYYASPM
ncbi:MAG: hypothetical protein ACXAD7_21735 [Candidatus Kariarchaeaceae archaeon]|jgi:hypothetical protein